MSTFKKNMIFSKIKYQLLKHSQNRDVVINENEIEDINLSKQSYVENSVDMMSPTVQDDKPKQEIKLNFVSVLTKINDEKVMLDFLKDVMTPQELSSMQERLDIASLLHRGFAYRYIAEKTSAGIATVVRVAKFLKREEYGGYRYILSNAEKFSDESGK